MTDLARKTCVPCRGGIPALKGKLLRDLGKMLPEGGYEVLESNQARASTPAPFAPGIEAAVRLSLLRQWAYIREKVK